MLLLLFLALQGLTETLCAKKIEHNEFVEPLYYDSYSNPNFVMRWHYQYFCDHVYDPRKDIWRWPTDQVNGVTFDPAEVQPGATIFVRMIPKFFKEMHPRIKVPYIVVSAGECLDKMVPEYKQYLDKEQVIAWFGVHPNEMAMNHPKYHPLPLGVLQHPDHYAQRAKLDKFFRHLRTTISKKYWVYMNFAFAEKPEREELRKLMIDKPFCIKGERQEFNDYLRQMAECRFVFSPEGLGPDCYRTWEAFLVGTIPIVRRSCIDSLYQDLPVLIIDKWEDINEPFLKKAYKEIRSKKYDISRLYCDFWLQRIKAVQNNFLMIFNQENP